MAQVGGGDVLVKSRIAVQGAHHGLGAKTHIPAAVAHAKVTGLANFTAYFDVVCHMVHGVANAMPLHPSVVHYQSRPA